MTLFEIIVFIVVVIAIILCFVLKTPFHYPYIEHEFNVSRRKDPKFEDLIDEFIISGGFAEIEQYNHYVSEWKERCFHFINQSPIKKYRKKQYDACLDDDHQFRFFMIRNYASYQQKNHIKIPYKNANVVGTLSCSYQCLKERNEQLRKINYETTMRNYHSRNQRNLMTPELRHKIMARDNYTCQYCGKYMPDGVNLHIDHIIPVSKGGKTIPSNLQVLCSKCNLSKSNKV